MRWLLWCFCLLAESYETINHYHYHYFSHNPRAHVLYHRLWYFIQIPYLSKFRATLFGISRFCTKSKACFSPTDSRWGRQISADNPTLIFNFNNFAHQPTNTCFISPSLAFHTDCIWIWCWQKYFICWWHCNVFLHNQRIQSYENSQGKYITCNIRCDPYRVAKLCFRPSRYH